MVQDTQFRRSRAQTFSGELRPVALAIGLAFGLGVAPAASAGTITVNTLLDGSVGGLCTLRDALVAARTDAVVQGCGAGTAGADTINFSVTGTISVATHLTVDSIVSISGPGAANLTIAQAAGNTESALYIGSNNPAVTISGITVQGNGVSGAQGIYHYGSGTLTIQNSVVTGFLTPGDGGGLYNESGNVVIQSSTFSGNTTTGRGGAIFMYSGSLSIDSSVLSGNHATRQGGAIAFYAYNGSSGALTITNSTLSGNQGSGGGAIFLYRSAPATITNSTVSGNTSAGDGGGVSISTQVLTVNNSTFTGNTANSFGGAFYLADTGPNTLTLNSTIAANSTANGGGGTADVDGVGTLNATNSLIFNPALAVNGTNNIIDANPLLGPLANNGGPTMTHALLVGSPAIDTGANPLALAFDQRGSGFARTVGTKADIGSFEVQGAQPPPTVTIDQAAAQADPTSTSPIVFTVVFSQPVNGFTAADVVLSGTAGATTVVIGGSGPAYTVSVSGMTGSGTVIATIPAGAATNGGGMGNTASTSTDNTVTYALPPAPSVTIDQSVAQPDPTSIPPIVFSVVFSQPVNGFTASDVVLSGTAGATTVTVTGGPANYTVSVSGMTTTGTVSVSIPAGAATNGTGSPNTASTSTDNTVTFNAVGPPPPPAQSTPIPTLSQWGLAILSALMAGWVWFTGFARRRRE